MNKSCSLAADFLTVVNLFSLFMCTCSKNKNLQIGIVTQNHGKQQYLPPTLQEVADVVVSLRHQMERLPYDLLLHVLRLQQNMLDSLITDNHSKGVACVWLIDSLLRESTII